MLAGAQFAVLVCRHSFASALKYWFSNQRIYWFARLPLDLFEESQVQERLLLFMRAILGASHTQDVLIAISHERVNWGQRSSTPTMSDDREGNV